MSILASCCPDIVAFADKNFSLGKACFKKSKMSFDVIYRVFCDCINIRFKRIFMRFMEWNLKNQNVSKYLVLISL